MWTYEITPLLSGSSWRIREDGEIYNPLFRFLARFFFGEPGSLYAREFRMNPRFAGEDIVSIVLGYDRLTCHCELSWRTIPYEVFIEGTEGTITWDPGGRLTVGTNAGETSEILAPQPYPWADPRYGFAHPSIVSTNMNLLDALRGAGTAETRAEDNLKTMRLLHLTLESARRNQARLPQSGSIAVIGIEGINAVVLGGDVNHVMDAFARYYSSRHIERLRVNVTIHDLRK